ncbi:MAG TPA: hypothetical protein VE221_02545, partial [Sphingomicrobium sp.]|nr:hypothetical protein [Sphingomicrobium sp.]
AILIFVLIVATWVDAWNMLQGMTLNFEDLWSPLLLAIFYYLAAAVIFPREREQYPHLHAYFAARKTFVAGLLLAGELVDTVAGFPFMKEAHEKRPQLFWAWLVPYNTAIFACFVALLLVRGRRANIALLVALLLLFVVPYWDQGAIDRIAMRLWGPGA